MNGFESQREAKGIRGKLPPILRLSKDLSQSVAHLYAITDDLLLENMHLVAVDNVRMTNNSEEENLRFLQELANDPNIKYVNPLDFDYALLNLEEKYQDGSMLHFQISSNKGISKNSLGLFPPRSITVSEINPQGNMTSQYDYDVKDKHVIRKGGYPKSERLVDINEMRRLGSVILRACPVAID